MSNRKTINDLRGVLFDTIEAVKSGKIDIAQAKCINDLSQTMVNTAKAEVEFLSITKQASGSGFMDKLPPGITGITRHTLQG